MAGRSAGGSSLLALRSNTDLREIGKALRGDNARRKLVLKAIQSATIPLKQEIPASARATLPKHGGLAELVADLKIVTQIKLSGRNVGVRIISTRAKSQHQAARRRAVARRMGRKRAPAGLKVREGYLDLASLDRGRAWHPTYGHKPWRAQRVNPGFFTRPMKSFAAVRARKLIVDAIGVYLGEISRAGDKAA